MNYQTATLLESLECLVLTLARKLISSDSSLISGTDGGHAKSPGQNAGHGTSAQSMNLHILFRFFIIIIPFPKFTTSKFEVFLLLFTKIKFATSPEGDEPLTLVISGSQTATVTLARGTKLLLDGNTN